METHKLKVGKSARYFVLGTPSNTVRQIWFVCHGYGQLGNYFLKNFELLKDDTILFVSCEGLNRFYVNGFSGRIGASWMTKEDRVDEIEDYVFFLNAVYDQMMVGLDPQVKVTALGFSQGSATICRWAGASNRKIDRLVLWAGAFPTDVDLQINNKRFSAFRNVLVVGDHDEFVKEEDLTSVRDRLDSHEIVYELKRFEGKHELHSETLKELLSF
jgi:predicted esterase